MRTIRRISAAFQLLDSYSKGPVPGAVILVDGGRARYVAKGDGTYVFSDLPPVPHTYEISVSGYCGERLTLPVVPPHFPEVVLLQHAPGTPQLGRIPHYSLRFLEGERPLRDARIRVTLETNVGALRLVERAGAGESTLALAGNYAVGMLYQKYWFQGAEGPILITGCDQDTGRYELQEPLAADLEQGTLLRPVWDLRTDRDGTAVLPAIGLFLQREEAEFSFACGGREQRLTMALPAPSLRRTVVF